jgi:hypothetical protein
MSRPQSPLVPLVLSRILAGLSPKEVAFEVSMTPGAISKMIGNTPDIRKQYVTHAEFRQLLSQRKGSA